MKKFGIGQPVRRTEDQRFITGHGRYIADIRFDGELAGYVLRSPHAHARIRAIDMNEAKAAPGVAAIFTGKDYLASGLRPIPCVAQVETEDGKGLDAPERYPLAAETVRHVGDPVAFIVAETMDEAVAAAELIEVDYEPLDHVSDLKAALGKNAPLVWPGRKSNKGFSFHKGDEQAAEKALEAADRVVSLDLVNNRLVPATMEPRGVIGIYDRDKQHFTLYTSGQGAHGQRMQLAKAVFRIAPQQVRVIMPDVGGGFGAKNFVYPEMVLALWAARETGRPVKWIGDRSESFLSDAHGRDHVTSAQMGISADGRITALKIDTHANLGAYFSTFGPHVPTNAMSTVVGGIYDIPAVSFRSTGMFTNTVPVDAYRGAGRPEANYIIERLVEKAAFQLKMDPLEIRRLNAIKAFPYTTAMGMLVDCGDFPGNLDRAAGAADREGFEARRKAAAGRGRLRGLGFAAYLETTLGMPSDNARLRFIDGKLEVGVGSQSNGTGHETSFPQIIHEVLGIPLEKMSYVQADTDRAPEGGGHGGSRSLSIAGMALLNAATLLKEKAAKAAAHILEAAPGDIEIEDGICTIAGTDRRIAILDLPEALAKAQGVPDDLKDGLDTDAAFERQAVSFPNGCHAAEVEIDPDTGDMRIERYHVIDDFGSIVNPLLVEGQVQGGVGQGIGQALLEEAVYDPDSGQLLTGSFTDYPLPRAGDLPDIDVTLNQECPTEGNALGVKGAGEAGCTGAPAAVVNALCDALRDYGVEHVDMPLTAQKIWRLIQAGGAARA